MTNLDIVSLRSEVILSKPNADIDGVFLIDRVIHKEDLNAHNMYNIVERHFSISITPVRSRGGSLVINKKQMNKNLIAM
jgi:hypothetical protein